MVLARRLLATPRRLLGLSVAVVALLPALMQGPAVALAPAEAAAHEGQRVRMSGVVTAVMRYPDGEGLVTMAQDGHAIEVRGRPPPGLERGAWLDATGVLLRHDERLRLHADVMAAGAAPAPLRPDWSDVARHPDDWTGRPIQVSGMVERGTFGEDGHHVRTGDGPWPRNGAYHVLGVLAYDARCLCHVLHAHAVSPWTP